MTRSLAACIIGLIVTGQADAQQRARSRRLVGTGFFVYDAAGNVFIQISRNPLLSCIPGTDDDVPVPGASTLVLRETLEAYIAYFGTYAVDSIRNEIVHHVASDVWRDYSGTEQRRSFRLAGDTLVIGDGRSFRRVLVRVPGS